jgi:hypothetical protein
LLQASGRIGRGGVTAVAIAGVILGTARLPIAVSGCADVKTSAASKLGASMEKTCSLISGVQEETGKRRIERKKSKMCGTVHLLHLLLILVLTMNLSIEFS